MGKKKAALTLVSQIWHLYSAQQDSSVQYLLWEVQDKSFRMKNEPLALPFCLISSTVCPISVIHVLRGLKFAFLCSSLLSYCLHTRYCWRVLTRPELRNLFYTRYQIYISRCVSQLTSSNSKPASAINGSPKLNTLVKKGKNLIGTKRIKGLFFFSKAECAQLDQIACVTVHRAGPTWVRFHSPLFHFQIRP